MNVHAGQAKVVFHVKVRKSFPIDSIGGDESRSIVSSHIGGKRKYALENFRHGAKLETRVDCRR